MLFVSKKETLTSENLPDTSLRNVRTDQVQLQQQRQQPQTNSSCTSDSTTFFPSSQACLSKLTKEQFDLHREFLHLGSLLMAENADLFYNALTVLSAKHDLKMVTPATSVCDVIPPSQITRQYNKSCDLGNSRSSNRKYVLPKDIAEKEFYQCMVCKERRTKNSFGSSHTHEEFVKPNIRWYCPVCDSFFAMTHRGYHLKSRHSDILIVAHSDSVSEKQKSPVDPASLKRSSDRGSDEDDSELTSLSPPVKNQHLLGSSPSTTSSSSSSSSCSCTTGVEFVRDEDDSSMMMMGSGLVSDFDTVKQDDQLCDYNDQFTVFPPSQQCNGDDSDLFGNPELPLSHFE